MTLGEMVNNTLSHYLEVCQGRSHEDVRWMPRRCRLGAFHVQFIIFQTFRASSAWSVGDFVRRTSAAARRQRRAQPGDACCPCSCSSVRWAQLEAPPQSTHRRWMLLCGQMLAAPQSLHQCLLNATNFMCTKYGATEQHEETKGGQERGRGEVRGVAGGEGTWRGGTFKWKKLSIQGEEVCWVLSPDSESCGDGAWIVHFQSVFGAF